MTSRFAKPLAKSLAKPLSTALLVSIFLAACAAPPAAAPATAPATAPAAATEAPAATAAATAAATTEATTAATEAAPAEATAAPNTSGAALGTPENPIIMALAPSATSQELITTGEAVAAQLSKITGYTIKTVVPTKYSALVEAMGSGNAHIGWLPPVAYLLASQKGYAEVAFSTLRFNSKDKVNRDHYGVQFVANKASGFKSFFDTTTNESTTTDAKEALAQFAGKKPCFTDPLSASGYVVPSGVLAQAGISTTEPVFVQAHPTVVKTLLDPATAQCDFGATYIDVRDEDKSLIEIPNVMDTVVVIWRTPLFIPNDNVSLATSLPAEVKTKLTAAIAEMAASDEGKAALKVVYNIDGLQPVDDTFYDEFRSILEAGGFDVTTLVK